VFGMNLTLLVVKPEVIQPLPLVGVERRQRCDHVWKSDLLEAVLTSVINMG